MAIAGRSFAADDARQRRADQADADERDAVEEGIRDSLVAAPWRKSLSAATRPSLASSADGHAQAIGQAVGAHRAHQDAAGFQEFHRRHRH
jgi:hypothetical protein